MLMQCSIMIMPCLLRMGGVITQGSMLQVRLALLQYLET